MLEVMAELMGRVSGASKVSGCWLLVYKLSLPNVCLPLRSDHNHEHASQVQFHLGKLLQLQFPYLEYASCPPAWPRWLCKHALF